MAITQTTYTGNGSTTNYSFTFEYLKQADVKVTLDTVATTAFTFANATTIAFTTAPANGVAIRIFRDTVIDSLSSTFFPGSAIKAEDLNENFTQNLYVTQESDNEAALATATANSAVTTAESAVATANAAVVTANAADAKADTAIATANTADTNASAAVVTANAADAKADTAISTANAAVVTANAADTKADTAISTANTASSNATAAVATANSAQTDATTAIATANAATVTANTAVTTANTANTTANTANTNATAAQTAATAAQASATAAQTSATAAQASASDAQAQAALAADVRNAFTITDSNSDGTFDFVVSDIPIKGNNGVKLPFESVTYAEEGAIRYNNSLDKIELYNGAGQWVTAAGGAAVSSSPPSLPSPGDVWYDHDNGRAYVYYNDGDSNQWVEMNPSWNGYVADNSVSASKIVDNSINSSKIIDGSIVDADINASAAIAGTKISPDFGSQDVTTTGINVYDPNNTTKVWIKNGPAANQASAAELNFGNIEGDASIGYSDALNKFLNFKVNNTEAIRVQDYNVSGSSRDIRVSIGSPSAYSMLDVEDGAQFVERSTIGGNDPRIKLEKVVTVGGGGNVITGKITTDNLVTTDSATFGGKVLVNTSTAAPYNDRFLSIGDVTDASSTFEIRSDPTNGYSNIVFSDSTTAGTAAYIGAIEYSHGSNSLAFKTNATERIRIDNFGRLLINTTIPGDSNADDLTIYTNGNTGISIKSGDAYSGAIYFGDGTSGAAQYEGIIKYHHGLNALQFHTNYSGSSAPRLTIDNSGNVGIGTTNPGELLEIKGASLPAIRLNQADTYYAPIVLGGNDLEIRGSSGNIEFYTGANNGASSTERMRIDSLGRLLHGTTASDLSSSHSFMTAGNFAVQYGGTSGTYLSVVPGAPNDIVTIRADARTGGYPALAIKTGNNERLRIDATGNVGIGTSSPDAGSKLHLNGSSAALQIQDSSNTNSIGRLINSAGSFYIQSQNNTSHGNIIFRTSNGASAVERMRIDSSGTTTFIKTVNNTAELLFGYGSSSGIYAGIGGQNNFNTNQLCDLLFYTNGSAVSRSPTERMRIDSAGNVLIGRSSGIGDDASLAQTHVYRSGTNDKYALAVHHDGNNSANYGIYVSCGQDSGNGWPMRIHDGNGTLVGSITFSGSSTAFNTSSDYRLKENVVDIADGITRIKQLKPKRFNFITDVNKTVDGFLAHEAQTVVPEAVTGEKDGEEMQGIDQSKLVPLLTAALQEAIAKIETLEAKVNALEGA